MSEKSLPNARLKITEQRLTIPSPIKQSLERLSKANVENVLEVASHQIELMYVYYEEVLDQAKNSFRSAIYASVIGLCFIIASIVIQMFYKDVPQTVGITLIAGVIGEFIAGVFLYLYRQSSNQMAEFQNRLDATQRYLIANSLCEGLDNEHKQSTRAKIALTILPGHNKEIKES